MFKKLFESLFGGHEPMAMDISKKQSHEPSTMDSISDLYDFLHDQQPLNPKELEHFKVYSVLNEISFWATQEEAKRTGLKTIRATRRMMYDEDIYVWEASYNEYLRLFSKGSKQETFFSYMEREIKPLWRIVNVDTSKFSKVLEEYEIAMSKVLNVVRDNVNHNGYLEDSVRIKATEILASFGHDVNARIKELAHEKEQLRQVTNEGHVAQLEFELKHINAFIKGEGFPNE